MTLQEKKDRLRRLSIEIYVRTLRRNNMTFVELKQQAERTIEYCRQNNYSEPKFAIRILDIVTKQLDFIACREAELKALRRGTAEGQLGLADVPVEDAPETLPGEAKNSENGVHIARGLIVDNNNNMRAGSEVKSILVSNNNNNNNQLEVV